VYDNAEYSNGPQDRRTTTQMARDLAALEFNGAQMDFNKIYSVDAGSNLIDSYITVVDKVVNQAQ
jgi:hypothetical protein